MSAQRSVAVPASSAFSAVGRSRIIPSARRRAGSAPRRVVTARSVSPKTTGISYAVPGYARGASGPLRAMAAERESLASDRTARAPRMQEEKSGSVIGCSLDGGDEGSRPMVGNSIVKGFRFQEESEGRRRPGKGPSATEPGFLFLYQQKCSLSAHFVLPSGPRGRATPRESLRYGLGTPIALIIPRRHPSL